MSGSLKLLDHRGGHTVDVQLDEALERHTLAAERLQILDKPAKQGQKLPSTMAKAGTVAA